MNRAEDGSMLQAVLPVTTDEPGSAGGGGTEAERAAERRLVAAARADPRAFAPLYRAYVAPVYRYHYAHVRARQDAEDLTAATFGAALASLGRYREQERFAAWLFTIARHVLIDFQRRQRRLGALTAPCGGHGAGLTPLDALVDRAPTPEVAAIRADEAARLHRLLATLPADQREAVTLRYFADLRPAEIGVVLARGDGAVRTLLYRALARLRRAYREEDR
jgi:RNA polymerase sigma-70 factor (ECF subfamily)